MVVVFSPVVSELILIVSNLLAVILRERSYRSVIRSSSASVIAEKILLVDFI